MDLPQYSSKTTPFGHQAADFDKNHMAEYFAIFWEQGTGKTKQGLDLGAWLYCQGKIDCILIVAPNDVHRNWIEDEVPIHVADDILAQTHLMFYQSQRSGTQWHQKACRQALASPGLLIFSMSIDAIMTAKGKNMSWAVLKRRRCLYILDESSDIKNAKAKRTIRVVASGKYGKYRRIMTGTPVSNSPLEVYTQMRFLDENFWKRHGFGTYTEFKTFFGIWGTAEDPRTGKEFEFLKGYRYLDKLHEILQPYSTRVLKKDVLDIPDKLYSKRYYEMTPAQARLYRMVKDEFFAILDCGEILAAPLIITRMLRLQQITCGYLPRDDDDEPVEMIGKVNPKLRAMAAWANRLPHKAIIWCRFTMDIELLMREFGSRAVRYDGQVKRDLLAENRHRFQKDDGVQFFIGNSSMSKGYTITAAQSEGYYSNSFKLIDRLQSEDRPHRVGQEHNVNVMDLLCAGTIETHIVKALRNKLDIASQVTGDQVKEWI